MALNWFEAGIVKRSEGQNVIARAAYNARERLVDERTGQVYDYRHLGEVEWKGVFEPEHAPDWVLGRETLWNAVECREDKSNRPNQAQLARDFKIALPHELTPDQRLALVKDFGQEMARKGMVLDAAIHAPHAHNDDRNHHVHMLLTMREVGPEGFGNKVRAWNRPEEFERWKDRWSELGAQHLERAGFTQEAERFREGQLSRPERAKLAHDRGDMELFERLLDEPMRHRGPEASGMDRRGCPTRLNDINREIEERNRLRGTARDIREAYALSSDPHEFAAALEKKNMMLARANKRDELDCILEFSAGGDKYVPHYWEGEYLIAMERGKVYRLTPTTTGDNFKEIRRFLRPLDQQDYPSLQAALGEMEKRSLIPQVDRNAHIEKLMQPTRPPLVIEDGSMSEWFKRNVQEPADRIAAEMRAAPGYDPDKLKTRTAVPDGAQTYVHGDGAQVWWAYNTAKTPEDFQKSLAERGIGLARVTAEDASTSHTRHWTAKRFGLYTPQLAEGEYIATTESGQAYRLNDQTVGHNPREVRAFLAPLNDKPIQSLREAENAVEERRIQKIQRDRTNGPGDRSGANDESFIAIAKGAGKSLTKGFDFVATAFENMFAPRLTPEDRRLAEAQEQQRRAEAEHAQRQRHSQDRDR